MIADSINGLLELSGSLFILMSILRLHKDKVVRGIHWIHPTFFTVWGLWNLYYYPLLGQTWSFIGGIGVTVANLVWVGQIVYYKNKL